MSLKILHKKRWNVWGEAQKAIVRRDEQAAAAKEAAADQRKRDADSEFRRQVLLQRAKDRKGPGAAAGRLTDGTSDRLTNGEGRLLTDGPEHVDGHGDGHASGHGAGPGPTSAPDTLAVHRPPSVPDKDWLVDMAAHAMTVEGGEKVPLDVESPADSPGAAAAAAVAARLSTATNKEWEAEQKIKELKEKKVRGYDPWQLGGGAAEVAKHKPWYHHPSGAAPMRNMVGRAVEGLDATVLQRREERRKRAADPAADVARFLSKKTGESAAVFAPPPDAVRPPPTAAHVAADPGSSSSSGSSSSEDSDSDDSDSDARRRSKRRRHRHSTSRHKHTAKSKSRSRAKSKSKHKSKHKHRSKHKRRRRREDPVANDTRPPEARLAKTTDAKKHAKLEVLRLQRLARENKERQRAGVLFVQDAELKSREDAARSIPVYSSQFHPAYARQNRR